MKKAISLFLAFVMCLSLCACGGKNENDSGTSAKATIITNEGKTVKLSAEELFNEYDGNEARFNKLYFGASIEFEGTVDYIKANTSVFDGDSVRSEQNKIVFKEGWCVIIGSKNTTYDLADYYPGQKLQVSTGILSPAFDTEFLQTVADNNRVLWLIGDDQLHWETYNTQTTQITPITE